MIPIIPILAWSGGIAVGVKVVGGVVRSAGQAARGRPAAALVQVAEAVASPATLVYEQLRDLSQDVRVAFWGSPATANGNVPPVPKAHRTQRSRRKHRSSQRLMAATANGEATTENET